MSRLHLSGVCGKGSGRIPHLLPETIRRSRLCFAAATRPGGTASSLFFHHTQPLGLRACFGNRVRHWGLNAESMATDHLARCLRRPPLHRCRRRLLQVLLIGRPACNRLLAGSPSPAQRSTSALSKRRRWSSSTARPPGKAGRPREPVAFCQLLRPSFAGVATACPVLRPRRCFRCKQVAEKVAGFPADYAQLKFYSIDLQDCEVGAAATGSGCWVLPGCVPAVVWLCPLCVQHGTAAARRCLLCCCAAMHACRPACAAGSLPASSHWAQR